ATPLGHDQTAEADDLDPAQSHRLAELFDQQARRGLQPAERAEVETLVAEYGRRLHERLLRERARTRGASADDVRRSAATELDEALGWWRGVADDAGWRREKATRPRGRPREDE